MAVYRYVPFGGGVKGMGGGWERWKGRISRGIHAREPGLILVPFAPQFIFTLLLLFPNLRSLGLPASF